MVESRLSKIASKDSREEIIIRLVEELPHWANKQRAAESLARGDVSDWCHYHENGHTMDAVLDAIHDLATLGLFEEALVHGFTDGKGSHPNVEPGYWEGIFGLCDRGKLKAAGDAPPHAGPFTVYRGVAGAGRKRHVRGLSWTTDRDVACWFANRWSDFLERPAVYTATVTWDEVYFYTQGRKESEFVVLPKKTKNLNLTPVELADGVESFIKQKQIEDQQSLEAARAKLAARGMLKEAAQ